MEKVAFTQIQRKQMRKITQLYALCLVENVVMVCGDLGRGDVAMAVRA